MNQEETCEGGYCELCDGYDAYEEATKERYFGRDPFPDKNGKRIVVREPTPEEVKNRR